LLKEEKMHYYVAVCMLLVVCKGIEAGRHPRRTARSALRSADDATKAPSAANTSLAVKQSRQDIVIDMKTLENFINKLDSRLGSVESKTSSLTSKMSSVQSRMSSVEGKVATLGKYKCQVGYAGCTSCGGSDPNTGDTIKSYYETVKYPTAFAITPRVVLAQDEVYQYATGEGDWYGWTAQADAVTKYSFKAHIKLNDRKITKYWAAWIACAQ